MAIHIGRRELIVTLGGVAVGGAGATGGDAGGCRRGLNETGYVTKNRSPGGVRCLLSVRR
jgi:hypothetical protein